MSLPQDTDFPRNENPLLHSGATLFIDGKFQKAASGRTRTIQCPANGVAVATVSEAGQQDSEAAIAAAAAPSTPRCGPRCRPESAGTSC